MSWNWPSLLTIPPLLTLGAPVANNALDQAQLACDSHIAVMDVKPLEWERGFAMCRTVQEDWDKVHPPTDKKAADSAVIWHYLTEKEKLGKKP